MRSGTIDTTVIRVLIVEDHVVVGEALAETLSATPTIRIVGTARGLQEAVEMAARLDPDVVLMDVWLPDGDGAAGTARVLEVAPDAQVVVLTAATGMDVLARAVEAGASGFLSKAGGLREVVEAVRQVHDGVVLFSPATLADVARYLRSRQTAPGQRLTDRELEVLELLAAGTSTDDIAATLVVSIHTARNHIRNLCAKLGAHSKLEAVAIALRAGVIALPSRSPRPGPV